MWFNTKNIKCYKHTDGKIALYTSHDLKLLFEFYPYQDAQCVSATYPSALNTGDSEEYYDYYEYFHLFTS